MAADQEAEPLREQGEKAFAAAEVANATTDIYLLLTVFCSLALFLGGIATVCKRHQLRIVVLALAVMVMGWTVARMVILPLAAK